MHKRIVSLAAFIALLLVAATPAFAQKPGEGEVSLGYSVLHSSAPDQTYPGGFILGFAGQLKEAFSIAGEFGMHFASVVDPTSLIRDRMSVITFTAGPRFPLPMAKSKSTSTGQPKYHPFAQVLFGGARIGDRLVGFPDSGVGDYGFAIQPGAGVDVKAHEMFSLRFQADYRVITNVGTAKSNQFRFVVAVVFPVSGS